MTSSTALFSRANWTDNKLTAGEFTILYVVFLLSCGGIYFPICGFPAIFIGEILGLSSEYGTPDGKIVFCLWLFLTHATTVWATYYYKMKEQE